MNINSFLNSQTKSVGQGALILGASTLISRILGLIREGLLMARFGASPDLDIYFAAFRLPDFIYNILIAGGIVVAFLPLFSEVFHQDKEKAWQFTNNTLNVFLILLILLCLILFIFTPQLVKLIVPGFSVEQKFQTITLTRLMFLSPILLGLSSIFSSVLQYFHRFLAYGLCPIFYNLGIIFGILFLSPRWGILGVSLGVILGAVLHFLIQIPSAISCGFKYRAFLDWTDLKMKRTFILMVPRILGMAAHEINLIVITAIASMLSSGAITIFNFANNLQSMPVGILGVSFAIAAFPELTKTWAENKKKEFIDNFSITFKKILYLIVPISFLMFLFRQEIIEIISKIGLFILGSSQFDPLAVKLTAASLGLFCLGLFAAALLPLILRAFFALKDTKTPTLVAILAVILNIILSITFVSLLAKESFLQIFLQKSFGLEAVKEIETLGLPLAFSISSIFQFFLLLILLQRKWKTLKIL